MMLSVTAHAVMRGRERLWPDLEGVAIRDLIRDEASEALDADRFIELGVKRKGAKRKGAWLKAWSADWSRIYIVARDRHGCEVLTCYPRPGVEQAA